MMSKFMRLVAVAGLATSAFASPTEPAWKSLLTRQDSSYTTNITMGRNTLNWGDGNPPDVIGAALNAQCGVGESCDTNPWSEEHTVCPDASACNSCVQDNIVVTASGFWSTDDMRQALIAGLQAAIGQGIKTSDASTCPVGGGPYSAYYPGSTFTASQQASFVAINVFDGDNAVAQMTAAISVQQIDDNWCGDVAPEIFAAGGAISTAVENAPGAAIFGFLSAICA